MGKMKIGRQGIEDLPGICQVGFEGVHRTIWVRERGEINVQYGVAFRKEIWNNMTTG